jgi:hypothetical protein
VASRALVGRRRVPSPRRCGLHKAIEDTGIKLGCVATDIMGKSPDED